MTVTVIVLVVVWFPALSTARAAIGVVAVGDRAGVPAEAVGRAARRVPTTLPSTRKST